MTSTAATVEDYLGQVPEDRRQALETLRALILENKPPEVEEGMQYGHIGYFVPHSVYPPGYHCDPKQPLPYVGLASQKNHMALYLFCMYVGQDKVETFRQRFLAAGKKLDMGASCVRFKKLEDLPLDVIADTIRELTLDDFLTQYESVKPKKKK